MNRRQNSLTKIFLGTSKLNNRLRAGIIVVSIVTAMAVLAPLITWYPPLKTLTGRPFTTPDQNHPFGTDDLGRDIYSNVIYGIRTSMMVGFSAVAIALTIGTLVGMLAGYYGGRIEDFLMRVTDVTLILPQFLLALVIVAIFGQTFTNIIIAIGIVSWPGIARMMRAEFLSIKERSFVEVAKAIGMPDTKIILGEILPNAFPAVIPYVILQVNSAILIEAGLGFLGVADPNVPSLGLMLNTAQQYLMVAWWMAVFPGILLSIIVVGLNLLGDGLIEHLNPRLRKR
ncbi:MAG: ABC transporter permease [Candidatus Caldarchaeum sp.]|nr:ABC transporter permease [Candidatus Caldarchaeum sp.]MCX8201046.1 ABC transporter permease [Candidatus Caldarchaeum sp.]MDW8063718.1 ABC transporter permease [Candidatus Caldarchaeum sp.]MDW8435902.1 ABC transporter permease [Candidatus Caldarchaeum sp.]